MRSGFLGLVAKWVLGAIVVLAVVAGLLAAKRSADRSRNALPKAKTVIDEQSGLSWQMHGTPVEHDGTSHIGKGTGVGSEIDVRVYTVDHGDWVERMQVFDVPAGEVDFAPAMLSTFGADETAKLGKVAYVKVAGYDAATAAVPGVLKQGTKTVPVSGRVFASQIHNRMVTGGVAARRGATDVDVAAREQELMDSLTEA